MPPSLLLVAALSVGQPDPGRPPAPPTPTLFAADRTSGPGPDANPGPKAEPDPKGATKPKNGDEKSDEKKDENGQKEEEKPPERFALMTALAGTHLGAWLDTNKVTVQGWTELSYTASSVRGSLLPLGFNYLADELLVQQNWLRIERAVDPKAKGPTFGFRSDTILPGSDYRFTIARGLFDDQLTANNGQPRRYGIDPVQLYAQAYDPGVYNGLDLKVGRFFAPYGVESIDTTLNQLPSRSYTFIYNPFTHTGVLATLALDETWTVQSGLVTGSDVFLDPAARPTYVGSVKWAPKDSPDSVQFAAILGSNRYDDREAFHNPHIFDLVYTHKLDDRATYTLEVLYGYTRRVPGVGFANWLGVVNYLTYALADDLSATGRLEFFEDFQGQRTGSEGLYTAVTAGVFYKPESWLWVRPEVRYDHNGESRPFRGRPGLFTAALDVVVRW